MKTLNIEMTEAQFAALEDIAVNPLDWIKSLLENRAAAAATDRKHDPNWNKAIVSLAQIRGDIDDDAAVLAHGIAVGLFKKASVRDQEQRAELRAAIDAMNTQNRDLG